MSDSRCWQKKKYFDGKTYQDFVDIKLFDEEAPSFTLAIDYEFTAETSGATLFFSIRRRWK